MAHKKKGEKKPNFTPYGNKKSGKSGGGVFPSVGRVAKRVNVHGDGKPNQNRNRQGGKKS